ncbi:signal peptidase II [Microbacterium arborescens]|uniref:Lipoprotein signal peptidase n=1 Tax=Microbacterium arborescens TaxID=33883 RepID=A0ABX2WF16_9MICO|nr:signal peptidase II [Microbacterium paludicola]OAZ38928.1 signal peptidase II [Microbacterium arborescens]QCR39996.1 signal peptidase II [Microbacterium sp. SGAir0570]
MASRKRLNGPAAGALVAILAAVVLAADQFTKYLALENLPYQREVPVLGEFFQLYLTKNPGAAFSLGTGVTWLFTLALAAVAVVVIVLTVRRVRARSWAIVLGLLLGGVLGNLTDRLLREPGFLVGHVIDFIHTPWMWLWFPSAIYNVADMFIVTMMISVAVLVVVGIRFDGSRERRNTDDAADEPTATVTDR